MPRRADSWNRAMPEYGCICVRALTHITEKNEYSALTKNTRNNRVSSVSLGIVPEDTMRRDWSLAALSLFVLLPACGSENQPLTYEQFRLLAKQESDTGFFTVRAPGVYQLSFTAKYVSSSKGRYVRCVT